MSTWVPNGLVKYDQYQNTVIFQGASHTDGSPFLVIIKRQPMNASGRSSLNLKYVVGNTAEDPAEKANSLIDITIKNVPSPDSTDLATAFGQLANMFGNADFVTSATVSLWIPDDAMAP